MTTMQFVCDICHYNLFLPIVELEVFDLDGKHILDEKQDGFKGWKCAKCGENYSPEINMSTQQLLTFKEGE